MSAIIAIDPGEVSNKNRCQAGRKNFRPQVRRIERPNDLCSRLAVVLVDGKPMCHGHAGAVALQNALALSSKPCPGDCECACHSEPPK